MSFIEANKLQDNFALGLRKLSWLNETCNLEEIKLKESFLEKDATQAATHVKDLERTVVINKEIIAQLLKDDNTESANKKLNMENRILHAKVRKMRNEQCEAQAKILILEQIIKEMRSNEEEDKKEYQESVQTLLNSLKVKETLLELHEERFRAIKQAINEDKDTWDIANSITVQIKEITTANKYTDAFIKRMLLQEQTSIRVAEAKTQEKTDNLKKEESPSIALQNERLKAKIKDLKTRMSELLIINERTNNELQKALYRLSVMEDQELKEEDTKVNGGNTTSTRKVSNTDSKDIFDQEVKFKTKTARESVQNIRPGLYSTLLN